MVKAKRNLPAWARRASIALIWLLLWHLTSVLIANPILFCSPLDIVSTLAQDVFTTGFWASIGLSLLRIAASFFAAFILALLLGSLAWRVPLLAEFLEPAMVAAKSVPIVCFIVLLLIWFGASVVPAVAVFLVVVPMIYFSVVEALDNRDVRMEELLKVFGVPWSRRMLAYYWPTLMPFLAASAKMAVGMSWKAGIAAELIGITSGSIGEHIYMARITLSSADLFAWTLMVVLISLVCERLFMRLLSSSREWAWQLALREKFRRPKGSIGSIVMDAVSTSFGEVKLIEGFSAILVPGGRYALSDPSGKGKTTLLRLICGLQSLDAGSITGVSSPSMVFQESRLFEDRDAVENILMVTDVEVDRSHILAILRTQLSEEAVLQPVSQLSGGMRRWVELVRALVASSSLVILDEPFSGLDDASRDKALFLIDRELIRSGKTLLLATHEQSDRETLGTTLLKPWVVK